MLTLNSLESSKSHVFFYAHTINPAAPGLQVFLPMMHVLVLDLYILSVTQKRGSYLTKTRPIQSNSSHTKKKQHMIPTKKKRTSSPCNPPIPSKSTHEPPSKKIGKEIIIIIIIIIILILILILIHPTSSKPLPLKGSAECSGRFKGTPPPGDSPGVATPKAFDRVTSDATTSRRASFGPCSCSASVLTRSDRRATVWGPVMEGVVGICGKDNFCSVYSFLNIKRCFPGWGGWKKMFFCGGGGS